MLNEDLTRYVDLHRSMGFKFRTQHSLLRNFVGFAEANGDDFVRVGRVLEWAVRAPSPPQRCNRLRMVRLQRPSDGYTWGTRPGETFD